MFAFINSFNKIDGTSFEVSTTFEVGAHFKASTSFVFNTNFEEFQVVPSFRFVPPLSLVTGLSMFLFLVSIALQEGNSILFFHSGPSLYCIISFYPAFSFPGQVFPYHFSSLVLNAQ